MRLIDADEAIINFGFEWDDICPTRDEVVSFLRKQKTIDAVPVVRGRWVMDTAPDDGDCRCSNCHVCIDALHRRNHPTLKALGYKLHTFYKYCPNCGAKMEDKP